MLASITLLTPLGALAALAVAVPLAALGLVERRSRRAAAAIGLRPDRARSTAVRAVLVITACGLLAAAAAQPVWQTTHRRTIRTDAQAFVVVDVSRSMLAAAGRTGPTRLDEARRVASSLRAAIPEVPTGLAGMTDRVLPYLLPTPDPAAFGRTLRASVQAEAPPPAQVNGVASTLGSLGALGSGGFFPRTASKRVCIVVTDGESRPFSAAAVATSLASGPGCRLVVVRVGSGNDRIWPTPRHPEAAYRPLPTAAADVDRLATAANGRAFGPGQERAAARAVRLFAGKGPTTSVGVEQRSRLLAPWLALAALLPILVLLWLELWSPALRVSTHGV